MPSISFWVPDVTCSYPPKEIVGSGERELPSNNNKEEEEEVLGFDMSNG
jgi:hypothetical protein